MEKTWWTNVPLEQCVEVSWNNTHDTNWNEICASVIASFGLPGGRWYYRPREDNMLFAFKNKKDAVLCRIMISEHL